MGTDYCGTGKKKKEAEERGSAGSSATQGTSSRGENVTTGTPSQSHDEEAILEEDYDISTNEENMYGF